MEKIEFYYKGELKAKAALPPKTMSADRMRIAKANGVEIYDRIRFLDHNDICRMDTDNIKDKSFLNHELNSYCL